MYDLVRRELFLPLLPRLLEPAEQFLHLHRLLVAVGRTPREWGIRDRLQLGESSRTMLFVQPDPDLHGNFPFGKLHEQQLHERLHGDSLGRCLEWFQRYRVSSPLRGLRSLVRRGNANVHEWCFLRVLCEYDL